MKNYLKYSEIKREYPLFKDMKKNWFLRQIKTGRLKALNTSGNPLEPRYVISRAEIEKFLRGLQS